MTAVPALLAAMTSTKLTRNPFARDAALPVEGPATYSNIRLPWAEAKAAWLAQIAAEQLVDVKLPDVKALFLDARDGALMRDPKGGGLGYTPWAWRQLVSLLRAHKAYEPSVGYAKGGCPAAAMAEALRWLEPVARTAGFGDVVNHTQHLAQKRKGGGEIQLRTFVERSTGIRSLRAVVSGIHALTHTDDKAVAETYLENLARNIKSAFITRTWDETFGTFVLETDDSESTSLALSMRNSETGGVSLQFAGSLLIHTLDCIVTTPSGTQYAKSVTIANENARTRRRHTLPRFNSATGTRLTESARANIAAGRVGGDLKTALNASVQLAEAWETALEDVNPLAKEACESGDDKMVATVLTDLLLDRGFAETSLEVVKVITDDKRLKALPQGSAAHIAAAFAALASDGTRTVQDAQVLQGHAGAFILAGWKAQAK